MNNSKSLPFETSRPVTELTMVEVAEMLEKVSGWIESEREREREAKANYDTVARDVDSRVKSIKQFAEKLFEHQKRKLSALEGNFGRTSVVAKPGVRTASFAKTSTPSGGGNAKPVNLAEAIVSIWTHDRYSEPMTTEEISDALSDIGHETDAAPTSLRSSINQALAKLCKVGRVVKFAADGTQIDPRDRASRARKYLAAIRLPEPV